MGKFIDITGRTFGQLTVLREAKLNKTQGIFWLCLCECGHEKIIRGYHIRSGLIRSCGCLLRETTIKRNTIHGLAYSKEHRTWRGMLDRCYNPHNSVFHNYGGRNLPITVCDHWRNSFIAFYADMGPKPSGRSSIERLNNDLGYTPDNCMWVRSQKIQNNNKRTNVFLWFKGERKTVKQWSEIMNIKYFTLVARLKKDWTVEKALTQPIGPQGKKKKLEFGTSQYKWG